MPVASCQAVSASSSYMRGGSIRGCHNLMLFYIDAPFSKKLSYIQPSRLNPRLLVHRRSPYIVEGDTKRRHSTIGSSTCTREGSSRSGQTI